MSSERVGDGTAGRKREIACIVVSHESQPDAVAAVRSIVGQGVPVEMIVVNSGGGGGLDADLIAAGLDVAVIDHAESLGFGACANLGIAATSAPVVTFLAADCIAEPGWLQARLERHRSGAAVVSGAVTNAYPRNVFAWAAHVLLWSTRMPGIPPERAQLYSLSFNREVFDEFGGFRSDLRAGEDTELRDRIAERYLPVWEPLVRTAHRNPRGPIALVADQYRRGRRSVQTWKALGRPETSRQVAGNALRRVPSLIALAWNSAGPGERRWITLAIPLVPIGALAYALGASLASGRG